MSLYLDQKYINLVSSSLQKFKWKKINLANCRCPICGDSEANKNKARGYFFQSENTYFFKCHNCGASHNIYKFLEIVSPVLFKQYSLEKFMEKNERPKYESIVLEEKQKQNITSVIDDASELISDLEETHKAIHFLQSRKIPKQHWDKFKYTKTFGAYAKSINSDYSLIEDERIIIPIYDEHNHLIGAQGRSLENIKPKYITLKRNEKTRLIYGLNTVNLSKRIFVVEGPIDSLFLPNAIACLGSGNFLEIRKTFPTQDLIFVLDNEPRNREIVKIYKELIDIGEKTCIFPEHIKDKDINDMALNDLDPLAIIENNTHQNASALLAFNSWRKCQ